MTENTQAPTTTHPTAYPPRNIERIKAIIDQIEAHPETHNQNSWHADCGSAHCFAGWAQVHAGKMDDRETPTRVIAREWLSLTAAEADYFFAPDKTLSDLKKLLNQLVDDYDREGFDRLGYDRKGFGRDGYNSEGFDRTGHDREGFCSEGYRRDGYDREGFDCDGYNCEGFARDGFSRSGYNRDGFTRDGYNRDGYNRDGFDCDGFNRLGQRRPQHNKEPQA